MKIAITGIRGIPANYGGFETFAEELATRLVKRGHEVTVYGRKNNVKTSDKFYKGVRLVILPTIKHKYLDTVAHTFISVLHILGQKYDLVLICNAANSIFSWIPRLSGKRVLVNVDGIERKRKKWNKLGKAYYHLSEWLSTFLPDGIVTDAKVIQDYYWDHYAKPSCMIAYGASTSRKISPDKIREFGLEPEKYVLYVSRLEPENNAHLVIQAFEQVKTDFKLAIVGDALYAPEYIRELKSTKDPRIVFLGYVFGERYKALQQNAYCYVQATEVGGTHPALVEALGYGNCVLFLNTPEHREVTGNCAISFSSVTDLKEKLQRVLFNPTLVKDYGQKAMRRIKN
ncbi:MAG: DUF1972 domain-containing protein, partial [candidate division Zixibacteria bacterium]|nr:DUF1972 domain-containing protein [candidate division Zixibacteria bacterium]